VLEGSIQQQGGRARVTVQLVSAGSGAHLWSERWDRPAADVFAVQAEVAEQVATTLAGYGVIADVGRAAAKRRLPEDLTAYDLYLLGAEAKHRATRESTDDAIRLFARAVEVDPNLARAWVGLAWARAQAEGFGADPAVARQGQAEAGRRALELDPTDAEAHAVMAEVHGARGEFALGAAEYARAFGLNPSSAQILMLYTGWASSFGQAEEGARAANRAARINPNYPVWAASRFIYAYLMAGRPEDALRVAERIPAESLRTRDLVMIAASHAALGRPGRAAAVARDALKRFPGFSVEGYVVNNPRWSETERALLVDTMRMAGFPACATAETVTRLTEPKRLPECAVTAAAG
jgi:tetratricopeptide (TPR) repeat protein